MFQGIAEAPPTRSTIPYSHSRPTTRPAQPTSGSGCCNQACRTCQRYGGGKACVSRHCGGSPTRSTIPYSRSRPTTRPAQPTSGSGCCNQACRTCQRYGGGKACVSRHCGGSPTRPTRPYNPNVSPPNTNTRLEPLLHQVHPAVAAMKHADDVNALEEARHVSKNMDAMVVHLVPMCRLEPLLHQVHPAVAAMMHADDVNALWRRQGMYPKIWMQW